MEENTFIQKFKRAFCVLMAATVLISSSAMTASAASTDKSGNKEFLGLGYNEQEKIVYTTSGRGLLGLGFDYDAAQNIFFSTNNCWQRKYGYNAFYDKVAPFIDMNYDCLRFYFDYAGKSWLIQAWKGQYVLTTGCELGLYYKDPDREVKHFDVVSDADRLPLSVTLYHNGEKMFSRKMSTSWWQTGFIPFRKETADELGMKFSIKFKDKAMLDAFKKSIKKSMGIKYTTKGTTINISWNV